MVLEPCGNGRRAALPYTAGMPSLTADVLALLACPVCRQALALEQSAGVETIRCLGCGRRYPIRDGIPALIAEYASVPSAT